MKKFIALGLILIGLISIAIVITVHNQQVVEDNFEQSLLSLYSKNSGNIVFEFESISYKENQEDGVEKYIENVYANYFIQDAEHYKIEFGTFTDADQKEFNKYITLYVNGSEQYIENNKKENQLFKMSDHFRENSFTSLDDYANVVLFLNNDDNKEYPFLNAQFPFDDTSTDVAGTEITTYTGDFNNYDTEEGHSGTLKFMINSNNNQIEQVDFSLHSSQFKRLLGFDFNLSTIGSIDLSQYGSDSKVEYPQSIEGALETSHDAVDQSFGQTFDTLTDVENKLCLLFLPIEIDSWLVDE